MIMISAESGRFYADLPVLDSFFDISDTGHFHALPDSWNVGITDIENSTLAIENNQYKKVNILGAAPIIGLLNETGKNRLPYSFGGDGCIICIPPEVVQRARTIFAACRQIGRSEYGLHLRAAIIPVRYIREQGHDIRVARFRVSEHYNQAVFTGGGLNYAEMLLKSDLGDEFRLEPIGAGNPEAVNFSGLECRWREVRPPGRRVLSLLVQANPEATSPKEVYARVLDMIHQIFGYDEESNPISSSDLNMHLAAAGLMSETRFRTFGRGWVERLGYLLKVQLQTLLGKALMALGYVSSSTDWGRYKHDLALNTDHRKFDDMLRLVIRGTPEQQEALQDYLQHRYEHSELAYGIHSSEAALITCMVFAYHRDHIHFVDGSGGGYVKAAEALKRRLSTLKK